MKKLERARALLSNRSGRLSYEAVLEAALDDFLKDHDPEERKKCRALLRKMVLDEIQNVQGWPVLPEVRGAS